MDAAALPPLPEVVDVRPIDLLMLVFPRLRGVGRWRRYREHKATVGRILDDEIAARRHSPQLAGRQDVLSALVAAYLSAGRALDDGELRDQLITLLLAGYDTTASALAWSLELLAWNPEEQRRLAESVAAGSSTYVEAVVTEVLRLRPVIGFVARRPTEPFALRGHGAVPADAVLCPAIWLVHENPTLHPEPQRFRPERWLGSGNARLRDGRSPSLPFGGGYRRCLGAAFAVAELRVALEEIVRRYVVHPDGPRPERARVRQVISEPAGGARIRLSPR